MDTKGLVETRDLHPRVYAFLQSWDFFAINEYRYDGGSIDFLAIDRSTGDVVIIECKVAIKTVEPVVDQINRYATAFGLPVAHRWVFAFSVSDEQRIEFASHGITVFTLSMQSPVSDERLVDLDQFCWYYYKWHEKPLLPYCYDWRKGTLNVTPYPYPIDTKAKRYNPKKHHLQDWRHARMMRVFNGIKEAQS
jgi:hypothetical protein